MWKIFLIAFLAILLTTSSYSQLSNVVINTSECGINMIHKSAKVGLRYDQTPGVGYPVIFSISELPTQCYEIEAAYVWWIVSNYSDSPPLPNIDVVNPDNQTFTYQAVETGVGTHKCWGERDTRGYRADVTSAIISNGSYLFTPTTSQNETDGLTLIIIYRDVKANYQGHIKINDGLITVLNGSTNYSLLGLQVCDNSIYGKAMLIASDIQSNVEGNAVNFVLNSVSYNTNRNFWNSEVIDASYTKNQVSADFVINAGNDCYSWIMAGAYFRTNTCKECPLPMTMTLSTNSTNNYICLGDSIKIMVANGYSYEWSSTPAGFSSTSNTINVSPNVTTTYTVVGTSEDGCYSATKSVVVNIYPQPQINLGNDISICLNVPEQIGNNATNGNPPYNYKWTPSTGLSNPNIAKPLANPTNNITYVCKVTDDNGCVGYDTINVKVNPNPSIDVGMDVITCSGVPILIGNTATGGTPPFSYNWTPIVGLSSSDTPIVQSTVTDTTEYVVTVTDVNGCIDRDTIVVNTLPLPQPVIIPNGSTRFCTCDSLELDAGHFVSYLWSTNETTQSIFVNTEGSYTVTVTDENGCVNTSAPMSVTTYKPYAYVGLPSYSLGAEAGEYINIPIILKDSDKLDSCNLYDFKVTLSFNKFLLVPKDPTPVGIKTDSLRILNISGTRNPSDSVLATLRLLATLGNAETTDINIDSLVWMDCLPRLEGENIVRYDSLYLTGKIFTLLDLCKEGNITRLFLSQKPNSTIQVNPNPAVNYALVNFFVKDDGYTSLVLTDILGRKVQTLTEGIDITGDNELLINLQSIPSGMYFLILYNKSGVVSEFLEVRK